MGYMYIRKAYNMPWLRRGLIVDMNGKRGKITGAATYLHVRFDGQSRSVNCHPTWAMTFYDNAGAVIADYKGAEKGT